MTKKTSLLLITVVLIVLVIGLFIIRGKLFPNKEESTTIDQNSESGSSFTVPEEKQEGVVVGLAPRADRKAVTLKVDKIPADVVSLEYELSYDTTKGPRGAMTDPRRPIETKGKVSITREITLGTCSTGGKCVYDEGVTKISLVLKFNKTSAKSTSFSQEFAL